MRSPFAAGSACSSTRRRHCFDGREIAAAAPGNIGNDSGGLRARRQRSNPHDCIEAVKSLDLPPPVDSIGKERNESVGELLRRALALQKFRNDFFAEDQIREYDR